MGPPHTERQAFTIKTFFLMKILFLAKNKKGTPETGIPFSYRIDTKIAFWA
ncbi:hypothetical protein BRO54_2274 [Geobacillus proteiniphilus]|uniref:Uncharacterized protein n=1 Tax=Geobacillus proteiniphilus TaxID=860353 RepID=A0A1Q5SY34_9BACL|nr:hypothetical protein BRO54_2274 [Geobacillus proteiniphilus]